MDDVLADITGKRKTEIPPESVIEQLFELGGLYANEVASQELFTDILGRTYMDLVSQGAQQTMGQFFSPEPLARLMASMSYEYKVLEDRLISVCDPACGSGVMVLQFAREVVAREGIKGLLKYSFVGVDIDWLCSKMFAVQMLANAMLHQAPYGELLVMNGNSLGSVSNLKVIVHAYAEERKHEISPSLDPERINAINHAAKTVIGEQLELAW